MAIFNGDSGGNTLTGGVADDILNGLAGNDFLYGGTGNDTLDGGADNDYLQGDAGSDTYLLSKSGGQDTLYNYDTTSGRVDVVQFADVATSDLTAIVRSGDKLVLSYGANGGQLTLKDYFSGDSANYRVDKFQFTNAAWTVADIKARVVTQGTGGSETITGYNGGQNKVYAYGGSDTVYGGDAGDSIDGGSGNDSLYGYASDDALLGQAGRDTLYGGVGNDNLDGGAGNDYLQGDAGSDTYLLSKSGGQDTLYNYDTTSGRVDVVRFADVATSDLTAIVRSGDKLVLSYGASGGQLTLKDYFSGDSANYRVDKFQFTNAAWTVADIKARVVTQGTEDNDSLSGYGGGPNKIYAYAGDDTVHGGDANDSLDGGGDNDSLYGEADHDALLGQAGNDALYGGTGNDSLDGGAGSDFLRGDAGSDTYLVSKLGGQDTIDNYDTTSGREDVVKFTDVAASDLTAVVRSGNNLVLSYGDQGGQLTLKDYFSSDSASYRVDKFQFTDATTWTVADIKAWVATLGTESSETFNGYNGGSNRFYAEGGSDTVYGGDGADSVDAGSGNDVVYGYEGGDGLLGQGGKDTLYGGNGNDSLDGGAGNDFLRGEAGSDTYLVGMLGGQDTIDNYDTTSGREDVVWFTDVATSDLTGIVRSGDNLVLSYGASGGQLTLKDYFSGDNANYRVDKFQFTDAVLTVADIKSWVVTQGTDGSESLSGYNGGPNKIYASGGDDTVYGGDGGDILDGGDDNDSLSGYSGNDSLLGQNGDDTLYGGNGDDLLSGDGGDDYLQGDAGNDAYLIGDGGRDTIYNYDTAADRVDTVQFFDVGLRDLVGADQVGKAFVLSYGAGGQLTIKDYFSGSAYQVNQFRFADGAVVDKVVMGTAGVDSLGGGSGNDMLVGLAGADTMSGGAGGDVYFVDQAGDSVSEAAGAGTDTVLSGVNYTLGANLENLVLLPGAVAGNGNGLGNSLFGNASNNVMKGLGGNDTLSGEGGADTLTGGAGADTFVFNNKLLADTVTDFTAGIDKLYFSQAGISVGNGDAVLDNAVAVAGPGGFGPGAELVIAQADIAGPITAASAAAAIGSASAAYAAGATALFAVDNGTDTGVFLFTAGAADATVTAGEITLIASLTGTAATSLADYGLFA